MTSPAFTPLHIGIHAQQAPDKPALIRAEDGAALSYAQLDARSRALAAHLQARGLRRGDHLAILMHNGPDYLVVCCAAQRAGLTYTPVSTHLSADEVHYVVDDCGAKALAVSAPEEAVADDVARRIARPLLCLTDGPAQGRFESLASLCEAPPPDAALDECEGQLMCYSSGTTGRPKGIKRPALCPRWGTPTNAEGLLRGLYQMGADTVLLSVSPLYHAAPLNWALGTLRFGGTVVVAERFDALATLRLIEHYRVTHGHFVPTMFVRLLHLPDAQRLAHDVSSLRYVVHAAAPCPVDVKRRIIEWFGPIVHEYYAGSEGNGLCAVNAKDWLSHPGTVGRAVFGRLHILGDDGEDLPAGEIGGIYFGGTPAFEYHNDPEKSRSAFSKQGYSTLGDFGHVDAEGFLYIADRRTDLILSGGVNIYPRETEEALLLHPAVLDAAVVGAPNAEFGEEVAAVVELKPGIAATSALSAELIEFCRARIAHLKCPRRLEFGALPRTPTGKLLRRKLKERFAAEAQQV